LALKLTEFGEIMQHNGHCAVQGQPSILVPIESPYATFCSD